MFAMGNILPNRIHIPNPIMEGWWKKNLSHITEKQQKCTSPIFPSAACHL